MPNPHEPKTIILHDPKRWRRPRWPPPQFRLLMLFYTNLNPSQGCLNPTTRESQENKVVFTEVEEFVWGLQLDEGIFLFTFVHVFA